MENIVEKTKAYIQHLYNEEGSTRLLFHNWKLKKNQLKRASELLEESDLDKDDQEIILLCVLFLDTGISQDSAEITDTILAKKFLEEQGYAEEKIKRIVAILTIINEGEGLEGQLEKVVWDIHFSVISDKRYPALMELWREDTELLENRKITSNEWRKQQLDFFRISHKYHTDFANENWISRKKKNIKKLIKEKKKGRKLVRKEKLKAKFKGQIPDRGIQTLYRVTLRNHIKLSDIADTKANILLSVNAIIISLALANLIPKLDNPSNDYLFYPTFIFIIFSIISMIMSILATRPNVTSGEFTDADVREKKVNLLFFGNFHKMQLSKYSWAMKELIKDRDYIYSSLTKDLYYLGIVLERKYKLLRWTYTVFMLGMILSVIAFGVALKFFGPERVLDLPDLPK